MTIADNHRILDAPTNFAEAKGFYWHEMMSKNVPKLKAFQELVRNNSLACRESKKPMQKKLIRAIATELQRYIHHSTENYIIYLNGSQGFYVIDALKANGVDLKLWSDAIAALVATPGKKQPAKKTRKQKA